MRRIVCVSAMAVASLGCPAASEVDFSFSDGCYGSGLGTEFDHGRFDVRKNDPEQEIFNLSPSSHIVAVFGEVLRGNSFTNIPLRLTVQLEEVEPEASARFNYTTVSQSVSCSREKPNTACSLQCGDVALSVYARSTYVATPELAIHTMRLKIEPLGGLPLNESGCSAVRMLAAGSDMTEYRLPLLASDMCEGLR